MVLKIVNVEIFTGPVLGHPGAVMVTKQSGFWTYILHKPRSFIKKLSRLHKNVRILHTSDFQTFTVDSFKW